MKAHIRLAALIGAASLLAASECVGAELQDMGKALPEISIAGPRTALPNWQSFALDGLPGKVVRAALSKNIADQGTLATRGRKEADIYRNASPAVVLIVTTDDTMGSGSYL